MVKMSVGLQNSQTRMAFFLWSPVTTNGGALFQTDKRQPPNTVLPTSLSKCILDLTTDTVS